ncbi:rho-related BTB domain-containing protein 1 isoform X2 [Contarinia nasturtii]|uniref:rho-related BTB domain-containing protein 1 isoform X2 n=1 Tax=Contarinia nasturtii TaxID=265458 RepID=UPI0012D3767E|nr:rho-related BTB domain-containing protein 1 isoform X2 [Contarinia nasturtii]
MDNEQPHQELVKCVLVGDTAVGKTRLICARACNKHVSLSQLLSTHVPTVWAIDQYRIYKDVLERSWEVVDNVNVSLRLWDTFGDHDKDRRFAYGRSDVVLLCFSIANPTSLRNCLAMWYPEIRRFCPETPVILVGCKNDLRYMYRDEAYLSYFGDKSPLVRAAQKNDLVMPDEARAVAKELGIAYYETSVFTYFGVNELFENAIRAALIQRRHQRFWMTNLKRVKRPLLQAPFRPPKPLQPDLTVLPETHQKDMLNMLKNQFYSDLVIVVGSIRFFVHRFAIAAGSQAFYRLLNIDFTDMGARSSSESSVVSSTYGDNSNADFNEETEYLIRCDPSKMPQPRMWEQLKRRSSYQALPTIESKKPIDIFRDLHHPIFQNIRIIHNESSRHNSNLIQAQTIVTLSKLVTPQAVHQCLKFIYSGSFDIDYPNLKTTSIGLLLEIQQAAEVLEIPFLSKAIATFIQQPSAQNENVHSYLLLVKKNLEKFIGSSAFTDVTFELDDGKMKSHRAMLISRCDMMRAMLNGDFREAHAHTIIFPGVTKYSFHKLLCYLYTDEIPQISTDKCLNLLEVANRLCLPRLINLIECRVIEGISSQNDTIEAVKTCLNLLEPVKLHNAHQLAEWCMSYLCVNYNVICKTLPKNLKALHPENQEYLHENRWPPVWYLKDFDYYQRCMNEMNRECKPGNRGKIKDESEGCMCFSGGNKKRRQESDPTRSNNTRLVFTPDNMNLINSNNNGNHNSINVIDADPEADLNL